MPCDNPDGQERIIVDPIYLGDDNADPFGGNILVEGSAELLSPLPFIKDQKSVRTGVFVDFGNVFDTNCYATQVICSDLDLGELRYSVGFGLTWITGFGPITFSLAKPLNDERSDQTGSVPVLARSGFLTSIPRTTAVSWSPDVKRFARAAAIC